MSRDLPHNLEAEQAVLGALLLDETAHAKLSPVLKPEDFYLLPHQRVFAACEVLAGRKQPTDPVLVNDLLKAAGQLGTDVPAELVFGLARGVGVSGNVAHYARVVLDLARTRRVMLAAQQVVDQGYEAGANAPSFLEAAQRQVAEAAGAAIERVPHDRFRSFTAADVASDPPRVRFLWQDLLPAGKVAVLSGVGGGGKTSLAVGLAIHRATGRPYLGRSVREGRTVIVSTEDGTEDYLRKLAAWREVLADLECDQVAECVSFFDLSGVPFSLVTSEFGQARVSAATDELADAIKLKSPGADLIIMETISRLGGGDESNGSMSALVVAAERLALLTGAAVLLIGHVSKAAGRENINDQHAARGGSAITDNARSALVLSRLDAEQATKLLGFTPSDAELGELLLLNPAKGNASPRQRPMVLERLPTPWGLALREYQAGAKGDPVELRKATRDTLGRHLADLADQFAAVGEQLTESKLNAGLFKDVPGLRKGAIPSAVRDAIVDGFLVRGPKGRGGGNGCLLPNRPGAEVVTGERSGGLNGRAQE